MLEIEKKLTRKYQDNLTDNEVEYMYLAKYKVKSCKFIVYVKLINVKASKKTPKTYKTPVTN